MRQRVFALALLLAAGVANGQDLNDAGATPTPSSGDRVGVPMERASARSTMRTFLEAFYAEGGADLAAAADCLDLSAVPADIRAWKGAELAARIKSVLDRTRYIRYGEIPDDPDGSPYVVLRRAEGEIVLARSGSGEWLFTPSTVASIEALVRATEGREVLEHVGQTTPAVVTPADWLRRLVPEPLRERMLFLEAWQWIGILIIILAGVIAHRVFVYSASQGVRRALERTSAVADPDALLKAIRPLGVLLMLLVWGLGIFWIGLPVEIFALYYKAIKLVAIVASAVTAYRVADLLGDYLRTRAEATDTRYDDLIIPLLRKSLKVFVVAVGLLTVAQTLGTDITALLAGLGLGGLAVALAAQDTVSNLFGSVTVLVDRPFQVGDWVVVGDVEGTVEEVGFRSTRIRTFYNSLITLPNSNLIKASVDNLGDRRFRRWKSTLGIAYSTPPELIDAFCEGVRELVRNHPYTRKDYFHVYFNDFGDDCLKVLLYVFFETPDWATELRERHRLGVDIIRLASELGVEFAFPTRTLYLRQEEWGDPDAAGDGYPEATQQLTSAARRRARTLLSRTVAGRIPPPVQFDQPTEQDGGDGAE